MSHNYEGSLCPKNGCFGRLYVQGAEQTCDYMCNKCHTEFNVKLVAQR